MDLRDRVLDSGVQRQLEMVFVVEHDPTLEARERLAAALNIPEQEIHAWFQRRRCELSLLEDTSWPMGATSNEMMDLSDVSQLQIEKRSVDEHIDGSVWSAKEGNEASDCLYMYHEEPPSSLQNAHSETGSPSNCTSHSHPGYGPSGPDQVPITSGPDLGLHLEDMLTFGEYEEAIGSLTTDMDIGLAFKGAGDQPQDSFPSSCACSSLRELPGHLPSVQQSTSSLQSSSSMTSVTTSTTHTCTVMSGNFGEYGASMMASTSHALGGEEFGEEVEMESATQQLEHDASLARAARHLPFSSDELLPLHNVARILAQHIPRTLKVAKASKVFSQQALSEFMAFVITESADVALQHPRPRHQNHALVTPAEIKTALRKLGACHTHKSMPSLPYVCRLSHEYE